MNFKRLLNLVVVMMFVFGCLSVFASEHEEGEIFLGEDGYYYKVIDGENYRYETGDNSSITDVIKNYDKDIVGTPDSDIMSDVTVRTSSMTGTLISVIIYIIFAAMAVTSAIDMVFFAVPSLRGVLYQSSGNSGSQQFNNYGGVGMNPVSGQQRGMSSGIQNGSGNNSNVKNKCYISNEMRSLYEQGVLSNGSNAIVAYLKRRSYAVIVTVVVIVLLLMSSVVTDFGWNIGDMLLSFTRGITG